MKPLELTVYPKGMDHHGEPCYLNADGSELFLRSADAANLSRLKRLTDAELAAEYWAWDSLCRRKQWIEAVRDDYSEDEVAGQAKMYEQLNTIYRFATTPSYDE